jgi:lysophospholipase L1-like esterase
MARPRRRTLVAVFAAAGLAAVLVGLGRASAPAADAARARGYHDGAVAGYGDGFRAGRAEGLQEGRATAEAAGLPPAAGARVKGAFDDGYRAGANGAFSGYDGGWSLGRPYVIVLAKGANGIAYRIAARAQCPEASTTTTYAGATAGLLACQAGR